MRITISRRHRIAFVLILALGLALRLWRLDFGQELPYLAHTDEPTQYDPAVRIIQTGDLNPHFFNYPSLTIYIDALVLYGGYWGGRLLGRFDSVKDLQPIRTVEMAVGIVGNPQLLLLGRATTAVAGTATLGLLYALTRHLTERAWVPFLAMGVLAISIAHVRLSHYMTVDVIATFFAVACVTACTLAIARRDRRLLWVAALCGGLATSSKYNYAVLSVPVGLACLLETGKAMADPGCAGMHPPRALSRGPRLIVAWLVRKGLSLLLCSVLFCGAFVVASPYVLLDFENASRGILREIQHYSRGHLGVTGNSFLWYARYLWQGNPFYLIFGLPGLALAAWRRWRVALPVVVATAIYAAAIGIQAVHFDRNVLPVLVLLIAGMGVAVDAIAGWLPERVRHWRVGEGRVVVYPVLLVLALVPLLPSLWLLPPLLQLPDPSGKALAQAWFDRAIETPVARQELARCKIIAESYTVYLDPKRYNVRYESTITSEEYGLLGLKAGGYDIVILGSGMYARFYENPEVYADEVRTYDAFFALPDVLAFEGRYDPLEFREGGGQVNVFFLTEQGRQFWRAVE